MMILALLHIYLYKMVENAQNSQKGKMQKYLKSRKKFKNESQWMIECFNSHLNEHKLNIWKFEK